MAEFLVVKGLRKAFGGIIATNDVSFSVQPGEIHAIIGPNGAGKSTLLSQLAGSLRPDAGSIEFKGREITPLNMTGRVDAGIVRSFQITTLCPDLSALEHVVLAAQRHQKRRGWFWRNAISDTEILRDAEQYLERVGLVSKLDIPVTWLSYGEQRQLEVAIALACRPALLLLDEPLAGLSIQQSGRMIELIGKLRADVAIILIEHDMEAVFALADHLTVLHQGQVIASGLPAVVRQDEAVKTAYLGDEEADHA